MQYTGNDTHQHKGHTTEPQHNTLPLLPDETEKQVIKEELLQTLVENSFDLLGLLDENGRYLYVAESALNASRGTRDSLLGYRPEELIGRQSFDFFHPDDMQYLMDYFQLLFQGQKKIHVPPYRFRDASGKWRWMEAIVTNQLNHPEIRAIVVSCRDVSQQVETENKLKELLTLQALMEGEEKERSRIARDLHDSVANIIAAAKMQLAALADNVQELQAKKQLMQSLDLLDNAAVQVRSTSHNLMSDMLQEYGLVGAMQRYCENISSSKLPVNFACLGSIRRFSSGFELSLYRNTQELIGNAIKHSNASHLLVQLSFHENLLTLTIEDNGKGFNVHEPTIGTGLKSIQKWVKVMNGKMEINSEENKGTSIYLEFEK